LKKDTVFFRQAELLLRVLPFVNEEEIFALKGGTAITLAYRWVLPANLLVLSCTWVDVL
jgi:hypothetical protein